MIIAMLLAAAAPSAVDAERAFARDAQTSGQWTAFRKTADPDAVMFTPQAVWAHEFLKNRKDPPVPVRWWPARSFVSCDGRTAVNTGPWVRDGGKRVGYFTTVWLKENNQWRWSYDTGDELKTPLQRPRRAAVRKASCRGKPGPAPLLAPPTSARKQGGGAPDDYGRGQSADATLGWDWKVGPKGAHHFRTYLWNGRRHELVLEQKTTGE
ncbi:MAG: hypothetical protein ABIP91_08975 [Sphingomicrobium sp.]